MRIDMNQANRAMFFAQGAQDRQGDGVVSAEGQRDQRKLFKPV
jgi:hypothetical protein